MPRLIVFKATHVNAPLYLLFIKASELVWFSAQPDITIHLLVVSFAICLMRPMLGNIPDGLNLGVCLTTLLRVILPEKQQSITRQTVAFLGSALIALARLYLNMSFFTSLSLNFTN